MSKKYVSKEVSKEIHEKAAPFIKWLREADEEESSSEDDEDVEVRIIATIWIHSKGKMLYDTYRFLARGALCSQERPAKRHITIKIS